MAMVAGRSLPPRAKNATAMRRPSGSVMKPTYYILGLDDRTVHPDLQHFVAKRMNAKVTELRSSHVPMLSQPQRVYEVIRDAAESISQRAEPAQEPILTVS